MNIDEIKLLTGLRIKNIRERLKYTQEQMSELIQIDISALSKIENGKNFPSYETLYKFFGIMIKISKALDAEPNEMFDYSHFKTPKELETELLEIFNSLSTEKQMFYYRIIKLLQE